MENSSNQPLKRRSRRRLVRRLTLGLGLAIALSPTPAGARERFTASPRRAHGVQPPWLEPGGTSPPPSGSTEDRGHGPAFRGNAPRHVERLFPRAAVLARERGERAAAMADHPAGKRRDVATIHVERGDNLWKLAEERVGRKAAPDCWVALYHSNKRVIGRDPDHIEPGQELEIPKECT